MASMNCPDCGAEMNHHADKLVDPSTREEAVGVDPAVGGLVEEVFTCPNCGRTESRRAV